MTTGLASDLLHDGNGTLADERDDPMIRRDPVLVSAIIGDEPCAVSGLRWDHWSVLVLRWYRWCSSSPRQVRLRALFRGGSRAGASARRSSASSLCDGLAPR